MKTCAELFEELNEIDEHHQIEAKKVSEVGDSLMETICAYSNESGLGGGYILIGVIECEQPSDHRYCIVGIDNPEKIQNDITTQCSTRFNKPIRPNCFTEKLEGKTVIGIYVPEVESGDKPIYFKKVGLPKGAFRRIGSSDVKCTEDDLLGFYQERNAQPYDQTIVPHATLNDFDPQAVAEYRRLRKEKDPEAEELMYENTGLLESLNCILSADGTYRPTIAGILLFGTRAAIRRFFPMVRLDYIRVSGRGWVEDPDSPFETIEMQDPIFRLMSRGRGAILDDLPTKNLFTDGSVERKDEPRIPRRVIREALTNALMHRSYQVHSPVQVIRYSNRLEIRNPGFSLKPVEELGRPGSRSRNPTIASVLHETKEAETKGSGIRVMRQYMMDAHLSPPSFESNRDENQFVATFLFHHFLDREDIKWLSHFKDANLSEDEARILIHAREMNWVNNAICRDYTGLDTLGVSGILKKLRNLGLLKQHSHASATYYTPTKRLLHPEVESPGDDLKEASHDVQPTLDFFDEERGGSLPTKLDAEMPALSSLPTKLSSLPTKLDAEMPAPSSLPTKLNPLSAELEQAIQRLGKRSAPAEVQVLIAQLCEIRPYTRSELSLILDRSPKYIYQTYLKSMLRDGVLELLIPERPSSPKQAYWVRSREDDE